MISKIVTMPAGLSERDLQTQIEMEAGPVTSRTRSTKSTWTSRCSAAASEGGRAGQRAARRLPQGNRRRLRGGGRRRRAHAAGRSTSRPTPWRTPAR
ncbi:MAG: pilus assembly protein PilM [Chromatiales bacterium]|nr:pilus assembly protein PilM [Chromatiales bacterium]